MRRLYRFSDWPLAIKLIASMVALSVIALVASAVVTNILTSRELDQAVDTDYTALAVLQGERTGILLEAQMRLADAGVATRSDTLGAVNARNDSYTGSEQEILAGVLALDKEWQDAPEAGNALIRQILNNETARELGSYMQASPGHIEVFVTDRYGATVAASDRLSDYYQADEGWWQAAWNEGQGAIYFSSPTYDESADATIIQIALPIRDERTGEIIGIVRDSYNLQALIDDVSEFTLGDTGEAELLDHEGRYVVAGTGEEAGELVPEEMLLNERLFSGRGSDTDAPGDEEERVVTAWAPVTTNGTVPEIDELGWVALIRQERAEAFQHLTALQLAAAVVAVIAALGAAGLAFLLARVLVRQVNELDEVFSDVRIGEFNTRARVLGGDELGRMADGVNGMLEQMTSLLDESENERIALETAVARLVEDVSELASGNLGIQAEVDEDAATREIAKALNFAIGELRGLVVGVENTASEVTGASTAMTDIVQLMVDQATHSAEVAEQAATSAQEGDRAVNETVAAMFRIRDNTQETARRIKRLGEVSQEISEAVRFIEEMSDRTTVLALNASIQAAAAGEAGRGFAVVAEEVQRLAERAAGATREIENLVKSIQAETNEAVISIEESTREVVEGSQLAQQAGTYMTELNTLIGQLANLIQQASETTAQQTSSSVNTLTVLSRGLQTSVAVFGLGDGTPVGGNGSSDNGDAVAVLTGERPDRQAV